jgi:hypothetical protein
MTDHTGVHTLSRVQSWPLPGDGPATGPLPPAHRAAPAARPRRTISVRITAAIAALAFVVGAGLAMLLGPLLGGPGGGPGGQPPGTSSSQVGGAGTTSGATST